MERIIETIDSLQHSCSHAVTKFDAEQGIVWYFMNPKPRPCITLEMLADYQKCRSLWGSVNRKAVEEGEEPPIRYAVHGSFIPGVYNYGGDLDHIIKCVRNSDREGLREYAHRCIEVVHLISVNLHQPLTTISLVQGDALGGGFEAALSCNLIVAEKGAQFGLPEILFNLFPGMGAYSMLSRKLGSVQAERIIKSGSLYNASDLHEMGVVDILAEEGEGEEAIYEYVARNGRRRNALQSLLKVRQRVNPVPWEELVDIAEIWIDTAMSIGSRELRIMERLIRAQDRARQDPGRSAIPYNIRA